MSEGPICKSCGHTNAPDAMFCSKCGTKIPPAEPSRPTDPEPRPAEVEAAEPRPAEVEASPPPPEPEPPPPEPSSPEPAPQAPPPRARRVAASAKTMVGMGGIQKEAIAAAKQAADERRAAKAAAKAAAEAAPAAPPAEEVLKPPPAIPAGSGRTMLGMPAPDKAQVAEAVERAKQNRAEKEARKAAEAADGRHPSVRPEAALDPTTNRTMLGQPAPKKDEIEAAIAKSKDKKPEGLGDQPSSGRMRAPVMYPSDTGEEEALTLPTRKPPRGLAIGALVIGLVVLAVGGGVLAWALLGGGPGLRASVVQGQNGEMLEIEVPGAEAGTRVRFGGHEEALEAGRVRFPLSADDLRLGDNRLTVDVVAPGGSVESRTVELHLEMRVRADLGPLANAPPAIEVIVEAPAGSEVTLDGEALEVDGSGRGSRRFEIDGADASAEGMVEHVVRYRIHPPEGEDSQGELRTRIPLTSLQLDRPGTSVVTEQASVEFAGAVAPGATVTIAGHTVPVTEGRFVHPYAIPEVGEQTVEVVARVAGRAPRVQQVQIRRVADLEAEAASFEHNAELTYARISQNPATYRGQAVRFEGLVYNVDVRNGGSILQILVRDCPEGDQCPLWVTFPMATEIERRQRVRVFGTVAGEQQFRSQSGQIRTVPRVDAAFILPSAEAERR